MLYPHFCAISKKYYILFDIINKVYYNETNLPIFVKTPPIKDIIVQFYIKLCHIKIYSEKEVKYAITQILAKNRI